MDILTEHAEQVIVVEFCRANQIPHFAVANGAVINPKYIARLKKEGMTNGVSDLIIPVARHGFHHLYLEMKKLDAPFPTTNTSPDQTTFLEMIAYEDNLGLVCKGHEVAIECVKRYMFSGMLVLGDLNLDNAGKAGGKQLLKIYTPDEIKRREMEAKTRKGK